MSCNTILPKNIDEAINALDLVGCERIGGVQEQIAKIEHFNDALEIDEAFLALMVDEYEAGRFYEFASGARELVGFAQQNYPKLGTLGAVKKVFEALGIEATVKEWFETGKEPYIFDIDLSLSDRQITSELVEKLKRLIEFTKNVRSRLDEVILNYKIIQSVGIASGGVGESSCVAAPFSGYEATMGSTQRFCIGGVGEVFSMAVMEV